MFFGKQFLLKMLLLDSLYIGTIWISTMDSQSWLIVSLSSFWGIMSNWTHHWTLILTLQCLVASMDCNFSNAPWSEQAFCIRIPINYKGWYYLQKNSVQVGIVVKFQEKTVILYNTILKQSLNNKYGSFWSWNGRRKTIMRWALGVDGHIYTYCSYYATWCWTCSCLRMVVIFILVVSYYASWCWTYSCLLHLFNCLYLWW